MEFASDGKVRSIRGLTDELFRHVLYDEEPIFFGDEASILDVSMASIDELRERCSAYYKTPVTLEELRRPLWQLLPEFESLRRASQ